jgi:hypothetical protein
MIPDLKGLVLPIRLAQNIFSSQLSVSESSKLTMGAAGGWPRKAFDSPTRIHKLQIPPSYGDPAAEAPDGQPK